jgi:hypothetical protein
MPNVYTGSRPPAKTAARRDAAGTARKDIAAKPWQKSADLRAIWPEAVTAAFRTGGAMPSRPGTGAF